MAEELNPILRFPHGPIFDPASLLRFIFEQNQPAVRQQVMSAFLDMSAEHLQSQLKFVNAVHKAVQAK